MKFISLENLGVMIKTIKENMYDSGAFYASMSGSGSGVYGIFEKEGSIENIFPVSIYQNHKTHWAT